ncbi:MAG TPA: START domain-containing protein, partial [Mucilaginibacter sp.]
MRKLSLILVLIIWRLSPALAQAAWKLNTDKDGIKVYTSFIPDSKIKAVKVEGTFNATPAQLVALLMDVNTAADWLYHTKISTLVKQVSPTEIYYYSEVNLPWPVQNRDFVAHLIVSQDPDSKVVTIEGPTVTGLVPQKQGIVRITDASGKWVITPTGNNQIKVDYSIHLDPGGSLPAWLVNMFAAEGPVK